MKKGTAQTDEKSQTGKEHTVFEGNKRMLFLLKWRRKGNRVHRRECWDRMSDDKCVNTDRALNGRALTGDTF